MSDARFVNQRMVGSSVIPDEAIPLVEGDGRFAGSLPFFGGEKIWEANPQIVDKLRDVGALLHAEKFTHSYMHCWRHKTPIIYRATTQWFAGMDDVPGYEGKKPARTLRETALAEVESSRAQFEHAIAVSPDNWAAHFALGVILHRAITGNSPWKGQGVAVLYSILHDDPEPRGPGLHRRSVAQTPPVMKCSCGEGLAGRAPPPLWQNAGRGRHVHARPRSGRPAVQRRHGRRAEPSLRHQPRRTAMDGEPGLGCRRSRHWRWDVRAAVNV